MNQKEFTQKSNEILSIMGIEELRRCFNNVVRKVPENKRETFLQLLDNCSNQGHNENGDKLHKRFISDEKVKETLISINNAFVKIEDGDLYISASGYEDYSNGYWANDWIWEYEDTDGIGDIIADAVLFAHDCMNDRRYEEALSVFNLVMDTQISVIDEGGDSFELNLDQLVEEKLAGINLRIFALDVLYTEYQLQPIDRRAASLYSYFSYPYFVEIHIEDIFSIGVEELEDTDIFWQSWIDLLMKQNGQVAARLLKEAILYHRGTAGMLEMARIGYKEHPSLFLVAILECEKNHNYSKMKEVGIEALEKLEHDLRLRGEIAIKTNLLLLYLYADSNLRKAGKAIVARVSKSIGFNESKNLVFTKENSVFEADVIAQKGEETFWNIFCFWRTYFEISIGEKKSYVDWLESVIDKRISAIIGGKYRNKYGDVALLAAALGEVEESLCMKSSKSIVNGYHEKYSRYSAFRGALKEFA